jgi:4-amino-4-deoxy-L-arabinose transferase-like glycosyltransferase
MTDGNKKAFQNFWLWSIFCFWIFALTFLSYFSFPMIWQGLIVLAGLGLFTFLIFQKSNFVFRQGDHLEEISGWCWIILFFVAVFLRFYRLTTLSTWPITDEGYHGFLALDLFKTGKFHFFYTVARFPPFYIWSLAGFFRLVSPSLFSLWLFPALLSCLTVVLAYLAARRTENRSFTLFFTALTALSFWPVYAARYSHPAVLMLLWEYLALWRLVCFTQSDDAHRTKESFWLGLTVGTGFYTFTAWPAAAVVFSLPVLAHLHKSLKKKWLLCAVYF